jgi:hypothetical protein
MSLIYGYDLEEDDDMMTAPSQASKMMSQLLLPGAVLVNNIPIRAVSFVTIAMLEPDSNFSEVHPFMGAMAQL